MALVIVAKLDLREITAVGKDAVAKRCERSRQHDFLQQTAIENLGGQRVARQRGLGKVEKAQPLGAALLGITAQTIGTHITFHPERIGSDRCLGGRFAANDHVLLVVETVDAGIEQVYSVVAVVAAIPAPVDMHQAFGIITVEDKGVATSAHRPDVVYTGIHQGTVVAELIENDIHPNIVAIGESGAVEQLGIGKTEVRL